MKLTKMLALLFIALLGSINAAAQEKTPDFTPLDAVIKTLRDSDDQTLSLRVDKTSFVVLQQKTSTVSEADANKTIELNPKGAAWLKYGNDGYSICYEIDADTVIEAPRSNKSAPRDHRKVIWAPVAKYDLSDWNAFAGYLVANGLYSYSDSTYRNSHRYLLSFSPITPASISIGSESLLLSAEFSRHLRLSPRHPSAPGSNGFVIVFHDPHWDTIGASEALAGLRALINANTNRKFEFLVEGSYQGSRNIGLATLPQALDATARGPARTRMVQSLLHNFLIDTPMAYRLLHGPIKTTAIDDNGFLAADNPRIPRPLHDQINSLREFNVAVDNLSSADPVIKKYLSDAVAMTSVFLTAEMAEVTDEAYVDYFSALSEQFRKLADETSLLGSDITSNLLSGAAAFSRDADAYADEAKGFELALKRNDVMAAQITAASGRFPRSIPIAFIGSFHTEGITRTLRDNGVGYVVIETRPRSSASRLERERFSRAIDLNTYDAFVASVRLHKLNVAPTVTKVQTIYRPKMVRKGIEIRRELKAAQTRIAAIQDAKLDVNEFLTAAGESGNLAKAKLVFNGGNQPPPPSEFAGAFAYFEPGDGEGGSASGPAFTVNDVRDARWSSTERYKFLRSVVFPKRSDPGGLQLESEVTVYSDLSGEWIFTTVFDSKSGRVYCFEERMREIHKTSLLPVPIPSEKGFTDIRMQVVEVIKRKEKARG